MPAFLRGIVQFQYWLKRYLKQQDKLPQIQAYLQNILKKYSQEKWMKNYLLLLLKNMVSVPTLSEPLHLHSDEEMGQFYNQN